jgi:maleylacetoacetate isomerase
LIKKILCDFFSFVSLWLCDMSSVRLYSYWRSTCSWRVRIALALKEIDYEYIPVHLLKNGGEQHSEEYKNLNPSELVPTLIDGENHLSQSLAILEYLEEKYPDKGAKLLPVDFAHRATVRALCHIISSDTQPIQNLRVLEYVHSIGGNKMEWGKHWVTNGLSSFEKTLQRTAGTYCFGDTITLADCCLIPQLYNARRFGVELSAFPIISRIENTLTQLDAFKKAHPENQPDAQV